jgi:AraC-like DNA-binding protein
MRPLLRLVDYLCRDLADDDGLLRDAQVRRDLEDALLGALIAAVPHVRGTVGREASCAIPYYLRRAENHLRDNAFRVVRMSEMATLTGVSERTLQDGFSRFRGKTPGQFARDLRLDLVRRALSEQKDGDNNVTKIALRFGFTHLGRFSRSYADRFGEYPSETLRRKHKP